MNSLKSQFTMQLDEFMTHITKMQVENHTTRVLVKKQMEEFAAVYSCIEINKTNIERMERRIETLPVIHELEDTDDYLNKYLPFKIQNMIDDTMLNVLGNIEQQKLLQYEEKTFKTLMTNLRTKESKLIKNEFYAPTAEDRAKSKTNKNMEKLRVITHAIGATATMIAGAGGESMTPSVLRLN